MVSFQSFWRGDGADEAEADAIDAEIEAAAAAAAQDAEAAPAAPAAPAEPEAEAAASFERWVEPKPSMSFPKKGRFFSTDFIDFSSMRSLWLYI